MIPATVGLCGRYRAKAARPTSVHTARYDTTNRARPAVDRPVALGARAGSIMAAIIGTHTDRKKGSDPSMVAVPMSIPCMRETVMIQPAAPSPTVTTAGMATVARVIKLGLVLIVNLSLSWRRHERPRPGV